ncbi:MAG: hypothetical protein AB8H47_20320 [Bacteroidia bacterium]
MKNILQSKIIMLGLSLGLALSLSCKQPISQDEAVLQLEGPYFGLVPTDTPQMLAPGIISTVLTEYNGTFSPDGNAFFYTSEAAGKGNITYTKLGADNTWTKAEIADFSGKYSEYDPLFSPDGNRLYFSSERPMPQSEQRTTNIWFVNRTESGWSEPNPLALSGMGDYYSSITQNGDIYFNIWNTGKILKATKTDSTYFTQELPEIINSRSDVGDPFISPNEDYLIYRAFYDEGYGRGDLYISFNIEGNWTKPENLGDQINTNGHEICPYVTADGKMFIFASDRLQEYYSDETLAELQAKYQSYDNGNSNIYYMSAAFIQRMKAKHTQ